MTTNSDPSPDVKFNRLWQDSTFKLKAVQTVLLDCSNSKELPRALMRACGGFIADHLGLFYPSESFEPWAQNEIREACISLHAVAPERALEQLRRVNSTPKRDLFDNAASEISTLVYALDMLINAGKLFTAADAMKQIDCRYLPAVIMDTQRLLVEKAHTQATGAALHVLGHLKRQDKTLALEQFDRLIRRHIEALVRSNSANRYWFRSASLKQAFALEAFRRESLVEFDSTEALVQFRNHSGEDLRSLIRACFTSAFHSRATGTRPEFLVSLNNFVAPLIATHFKPLYRGYTSYAEVREEVIDKCLQTAERSLRNGRNSLKAARALHEALRHFSTIDPGRPGLDGCRPNMKTAKVLDNVLYYLSFSQCEKPSSKLEAWNARESPSMVLDGDSVFAPAIASLLTSLMEVADLLAYPALNSRVEMPRYDQNQFLLALSDIAVSAGLWAGALPFTEEQLLYMAICEPVEAEQRMKREKPAPITGPLWRVL